MDDYTESVANTVDAGSLSLVFAPSIPTDTSKLSTSSSAITLVFGSEAQPTIQLGASGLKSKLKYPVGYSATDRQEHHLAMRFRNQRVTVWIDGIETLDEQFNLLPSPLFGMNCLIPCTTITQSSCAPQQTR
jgi:hypothetical protein